MAEVRWAGGLNRPRGQGGLDIFTSEQTSDFADQELLRGAGGFYVVEIGR